MITKTKGRGFGYANAILRMEHRPQHLPYSREKLIEILDLFEAHGVDAWWYSIAVIPSLVAFPSKVLPYSEHGVPVEEYRWLTAESHRRGIAIYSHYCMLAAPLLLQEHPEWGAVYLEEDTHSTRVPCLNSPYGKLLKHFAVEVVNDLGFDGLWLDCTGLDGHNGQMRWMCGCNQCRALFHAETGRKMPLIVDFTNLDFRHYVAWRQQSYMRYWQSLTDYVHQNNPSALLVFNVMNRLNGGNERAIPLLEQDIDALLASEVGWRLNQTLLQIKYLRAMMNRRFPPESWQGFSDGTALSSPGRPDPDAAGLKLFALACATAGGYASFGMGGGENSWTLRALAQSLKPVHPFIGGEPVRAVGLVLSDATLAFAHRADDPALAIQQPNFWRGSIPAWRAVHGAHNLLNSLHIPSEIVLENQFRPEVLDQYALVLLSDIQCLSNEQAQALKAYVERGGVLLATAATGTRDELGTKRKRGVLDDLFGITWQAETPSHLVLKGMKSILPDKDLPGEFMISGAGRVFGVDEGVTRQIEADVIYPQFRRTPTGDLPADPPEIISGVAIVERAHGRGKVIYIAQNFGYVYAQTPNPRTRAVIAALINPYITLPYKIDAPWNVAVSAWWQADNLVFHVLNQPALMLMLDDHNEPAHPDEITPTGPVILRLNSDYRIRYITQDGETPHIAQNSGSLTVTFPYLSMHAVIVCEPTS